VSAVTPACNVQGEVANVPVPLVVKPTVPAGVITGVGPVSFTTGVHVVADRVSTDAGRHEMLVVVGRAVAVRLVEPLLDA